MATLDENYRPNYHGLRGWLISDEARALCTLAAEAAAEYARATAPVGTPPEDRHPGRYRDSIRVVQADLGGPGRLDRVRVDVVAEVPYAAQLELHARTGDDTERGYHVLSGACDVISGKRDTG